MERFSPPVRSWFETSFPSATPAQQRTWPAIAAGDHVLLSAPTGSGKTLAAFLWAIDRLGTRLDDDPTWGHTSVVYISPLRALAVDVERNLRSPLRGSELAAERLGERFRPVTVGVRSGDTSPEDRRRLVRTPPDILVTTPESLYLMLTSAARSTLTRVSLVIIDEIHAVVGTKRGAHLSVTLERLEDLIRSQRDPAMAEPRTFQRVGLSATQRPLTRIARFLGGVETERTDRPVTIVDASAAGMIDLKVIVGVADMTDPVAGQDSVGNGAAARPALPSIWPSINEQVLDLVLAHRSTLIFVNARRHAERLAAQLNEAFAERIAESDDEPPELVLSHHGSLSRERRLRIEDQLKRGELRALVATSSLELGIDMGAVDLVVLVESPKSVASGLQRVGRAGHQVGETSIGRIFPKHRADLLECAVVSGRMLAGEIEHCTLVSNPLDVLAQQIVAAVAVDDWAVDDLWRMVRGSANFADLSLAQFRNVADMLAGRYPSDEFAELTPRITWDRVTDTLVARSNTQRLAVTNPGTIPDRGLFGVFLPDGTRVGELDEEMVYESRVGDIFLLGSSSWQIQEVSAQKVTVIPAPGRPGRMPFWRGDGPGRPSELGRAIGAFVRSVRSAERERFDRIVEPWGLDEWASSNLFGFLDEQRRSTGVVPDDKTIVVERFRDEIGDWRVCILSPLGARVHGPWGMVLRSRLSELWADVLGGRPVEIMWSDDGIVMRLPEAIDDVPSDAFIIDPAELTSEVVAELPASAMFASRFRECAGRSLLLPRRRPGQRTPLWQQRQRSADLLAVAAGYPTFPVLLEATRECCEDVFDLPATRNLMGELQSGAVRLLQVETDAPSPFAQSLLFDWIAIYLYEGDTPLAERRLNALSLDPELLAELIGTDEMRSLLDPEVIAAVHAERQRTVAGRQARNLDEVADLLVELGPMTVAELGERVISDRQQTIGAMVDSLVAARRAFIAPVAGVEMVIAAEDAAPVRDALGVPIAQGLPAIFTEPVDHPLRTLIRRFGSTRGPWTIAQVAARFGLGTAAVEAVVSDQVAVGRFVRGSFIVDADGVEYCDASILRELRRRTIGALRREIEPVEAAAFARFSTHWAGISSRRAGDAGFSDALRSLAGAAVNVSSLERDFFPSRVIDYSPSMLDAALGAGEVCWVGAGGSGSRSGRIRLLYRSEVDGMLPLLRASAGVSNGDSETETSDTVPGALSAVHLGIVAILAERGPSFWSDIVSELSRAEPPHEAEQIDPVTALWDLVWGGAVTNDSFLPIRGWIAASGKVSAPTRTPSASARNGSRSGSAHRRSSYMPGAPGRPSLGAGGRATGRVQSALTAGRWSLVDRYALGRVASAGDSFPVPGDGGPTAVDRPGANERGKVMLAESLLDRFGILTRETVNAESIPGGFAGLYPVLSAMEAAGSIRRGYFVAGLGGAQFARDGVADWLRSLRQSPVLDQRAEAEVVVLAADDPAQPYGSRIPWPETRPGGPRTARVSGATVILVDGIPAAYLDRTGTRVSTFVDDRTMGGGVEAVSAPSNAAGDGPGPAKVEWIDGLVATLEQRMRSEWDLREVDGTPIRSHPVAASLRAAGFADSYRGLRRRA